MLSTEMFASPTHLRRLSVAVLAAAGVLIGNTGNAQVLVRVQASSAAHQGPHVHSSIATVENGVVTTSIGNGGSASAGPAGSNVTSGQAQSYQPGGNGPNSFTSGSTTTASLATARHTGAVLNTPYSNFGSPLGGSISRLEDFLYFVNSTSAPVAVPFSFVVDGLITPPAAPFSPSWSIIAAVRILPGPTASPLMRGTTSNWNEAIFDYNSGHGRRFYTNGALLPPGAGPTWTSAEVGTSGGRFDSVLTLPVGVSSIRIANSLDIDCRGGTSCDYSLGGAQFVLGELPAGITLASFSGAFLGAPRPSATPSALTVQAIVGNQVTLRWTPPASVAATGYVLQGGIAPGQTLASLPTGSTGTTLTFTAPTGTFYLRVVAATAGGMSAPSNEVTAHVNVPSPPTAPVALLGLASGAQLGLSWRNTSGGGLPTGMFLDVTGAIVATLPLPVSETFAFGGVPPGTYTFAVRATNTTGTSAPSAPVTLTFPSACPGAPQAPANLLVTRTGNQLAISWDPPPGGPAISSYVLNVSGALSLALPLGTRTISGPVPAGSYTFRVAALNACGTGVATAPQTISVP